MLVSSTLAELPVGRTSVIAEVRQSGPSMVRLQELGLVPGTSIRVIRRAPLGEPIEVEVKGSRLAMRNHEAIHFAVEGAP
jgi:ferrous iron transport protein A